MSFLDIKDEWEYKYLSGIVKGLNATKPGILLDDTELALATNVAFLNNKIVKDTGYIKFGVTVRGNPRATFQWFKADGTSETLLITDATFYRYISSEWQYVSDSNSTTTSNDEVAGQTVIEVPATTGFSATDFIGIGLSDGTQHKTTVASVSAGVSITIDDAIPTGKNTGVGAVVLRAVVLAGSTDIQPSMVGIPSNDWFVFTNGVDSPKRYNGTDCVVIPNLPNAGNTQCRLVGLFNNYLLLVNTTEAGARKPQRVRWSDTGDPTVWSGANAGFEDLYDSDDPIIALSYIGPYVVLYRSDSIIRGDFINSTDELIAFETTVPSEGIVSQQGLVSLGDQDLVIGNNSIYRYKAGFDIEAVGDKIYDTTFSRNGDFDSQYKDAAFALFVDELNEAWFFYVKSGDTQPKKMLRYNIKEDSWTTREFNEGILGFGFNRLTTDKTWNDLIGDWTDQTQTWDSRSLLSNTPIIHLCGATSQIYSYDYTSTDDDGVAIPYTVETKDFGHPRVKQRFDLYDFIMLGTSILVEYSVDEGLTWATLSTFTNATLSNNNLEQQITSNYIRFRFTGSSGFQLRDFAFMFRLESEI